MADPAPPPLVISRVFAAPPARVFAAWSSADALRRWFSPAECCVTAARVDFRRGGTCEIIMLCPGHPPFQSRGIITELVPPLRLVIRFAVGHGEVAAFIADTAVTFEPVAEGTRMTVHQSYEILNPAFAASIGGATEGWRTTLDKLAAELAPRAAAHDSSP